MRENKGKLLLRIYRKRRMKRNEEDYRQCEVGNEEHYFDLIIFQEENYTGWELRKGGGGEGNIKPENALSNSAMVKNVQWQVYRQLTSSPRLASGGKSSAERNTLSISNDTAARVDVGVQLSKYL